MEDFYVYIMASKKEGVLYIGVTNNLIRRIYEHKKNLIEGFTKKYFVHKLVYFEVTDSINIAIEREKQLKKWRRKWKINLIEESNPLWKDLYYDIGGSDEYDFSIEYVKEDSRLRGNDVRMIEVKTIGNGDSKYPI